MPYIKKEMRPPFDAFVDTVAAEILVGKEVSETTVKVITDNLLSRPLDEIDGCLNYFITKLFKRFNLHVQPSNALYIGEPVIKRVLRAIIDKVYAPKYFNYNRACGMLFCCGSEFKRRYGENYAHRLLIKLAEEYYAQPVGPYEDRKIAENGDV